MNRFCPNCNKQLYNDTLYFCSNCGYLLDDTPTVKQNFLFTPKVSKFEYEEGLGLKVDFAKLKRLFLILLSLGFTVAFFIGVNYYFGYYTKPKLEQSAKLENTSKEVYINTLDLGYTTENIPLTSTNTHLYVPLDANFYIEGSTIQFWADLLFKEAVSDSFIEPLGEDLKSEFGLFGIEQDDNWSIALILFPADLNLASEKIKDITIENWNFYIVQEALILTNDPSQIEKITLSSRQIVKNISHSQKYSSYRALLPRNGQLLYMSFGLDDQKRVYDLLSSFSQNDNIFDIISKLKATNFEKFVIRNNNEPN